MNTDIKVFDRNLLQIRLKTRAAHSGGFSFLKDLAEKQIDERLGDIKRTFPRTHEIFISDFDNETEALNIKPSSLNLITSALHLHTINDLPGALFQIKSALKPDGLFIGAMFGGETLHELRESLMQTEVALKGGASPRVSPFADKQQMGALLQRAGFALPVVDSDIITVTYENMFKLMHDLRGMGETNMIAARSRINPGKEFFMRAAEYYQTNFPAEGRRIQASFEIIYLIGWAPHESQQKPLKPGSAKTRLAEALQTDEIKTGEKP